MDKSLDSIGSCSLDVDADSTDFSDTSDNFLTPSSTKDFTSGIAERCRKLPQAQPLTPRFILHQPTTTFLDLNSGKINTILSANSQTRYSNIIEQSYLTTKTIELESSTDQKKPSYLNLACCVNGYSNYTTYDSQERKDINKSREVSPIRPIIHSISMSRQQRSKEGFLIVPGVNNRNYVSSINSTTEQFTALKVQNDDSVDNARTNNIIDKQSQKSFIQQRVEKLYGSTVKVLPFVSQRKSNDSLPLANSSVSTAVSLNQDELPLNSLPVMKHLRPEFAKQLEFFSPKNGGEFFSSKKVQLQKNAKQAGIRNDSEFLTSNLSDSDDVSANDSQILSLNNDTPVPNCNKVLITSIQKNKENGNMNAISKSSNNGLLRVNDEVPDEINAGHHFLAKLNYERSRILQLAADMELELDSLQANKEFQLSEEVVGFMLSAIGKSRLLANKKMKQFEGLCENNLNPAQDEPLTTSFDLQGFWDMMMLQVDNVDMLFNDLKICKDNNWSEPKPPSLQPPQGNRTLIKRPLSLHQMKTKEGAVTKNPSVSSTVAAAQQKREVQRQKLFEMKRKQKAAIQSSTDNDGEVFF